MSTARTNTPILARAYNQWGLRNNKMPAKCCLVQPNGTLWALVANGVYMGSLYKSTDEGFSWTASRNDLFADALYNVSDVIDGPCLCLDINETWENIDCWAFVYDSGALYDILRVRFDMDPSDDTASYTSPVTGAYGSGCTVSSNLKTGYLVYTTGAGGILLREISPRTTSVSSPVTIETATVMGHHATCVDNDSHCHIIYTNKPSGTTYCVKHRKYNPDDVSVTAAVTIREYCTDASSRAADFFLERDGYDTLLAVWSEFVIAGNDCSNWYATSTDDGATWTVAQLSRTSGHAAYSDLATGDEWGRTTCLGGADGGFLIMYTEDNSAGVPKTYVRQLTTTDGTTYTLQAEKEIATNEGTSASITGGKFFHPVDNKLMDIREPGLVRVAYTVGDSVDTGGDSWQAVKFGQERLFESAYPLALTSDTETLTMDVADSSSLVVVVYPIGSVKDEIDFYEAGLTGTQTAQYEAALERAGTTVRLLKYEPDADNQMNDRSAYGAAQEFWAKVMIDPKTYNFPAQVDTASSTSAYVEQDIRKVYYKASMYLDRTLLVNAGGYLKRTVWLLEFGGNKYEVSQIVPKFMNNQICFYEANLYVTGPSRDPFSRTIYPSET